MRHLLVAAVLLVVAVGGFLLTQRGSSGGEPVAERDAFFAGSFVVELEAGPPSARARAGTQPWEAYRLTWVDEEAWQFEGTTVPGEAGPHLVRNQHGDIAAYDVGCFDSYPVVRMLDELAEVPGLTYATEVLSGVDVDRDGDFIRYESTHPNGETIRVEEDLSGLGEGSIVTTAGLLDPAQVIGTYRFTRLDGAALDGARAAIEGIVPSDRAALQVLWRPLNGRLDADARATEIFVLRDCPQLVFGPSLDLRPLGDSTWVLEDGLAIDLPVDAPQEALVSAAVDARRGNISIRPGVVIIEPFEQRQQTGPGSFEVYGAFVVEIVSCEETDWFRCEPAGPP